ncbi:MAG: ferritin-like domain-containing protein [Anaerolineae bacterium]|nr:ferritin-like domain-containing protein [Anaerolineae bacterium]
MEFKSFEHLFLFELKDIYDAEHQLVEALPKMAEAASNKELKNAFNEHLKQTKNHVKRLEQVFETIGEKPSRETCDAMKGLVSEGEDVVKGKGDSNVKDAALIAAAQRVEHYEMAGYGTLRTYAYTMGNQEAARLLQETLDEEEETDKKLTNIANTVNEKAM